MEALCLSITKENHRFAVPPAVALLNYLRNGIFRGFSLNIIIFAGRISEASMGGAGARSAPVNMLKSLKRLVCAVHGCARSA